jgi:group I intron endonuclease
MDLREQLNKVKQTSSKRAGQVKVRALYSGFVFRTGEIMSKTNYYLKKICGIYCIKHTESGKQYVGQSINCFERWKQHITPRKKSAGIKGAIMKYGVDAFEFKILEECKREELNEREVYWIAELGTLSPGGYNLNGGGGATTIVSEELRQKISSVMKIKASRAPKSNESKMKMSESQKNNSVNKGRIHSEESRRNMSMARKEYFRKRKESAEACKESDSDVYLEYEEGGGPTEV